MYVRMGSMCVLLPPHLFYFFNVYFIGANIWGVTQPWPLTLTSLCFNALITTNVRPVSKFFPSLVTGVKYNTNHNHHWTRHPKHNIFGPWRIFESQHHNLIWIFLPDFNYRRLNLVLFVFVFFFHCFYSVFSVCQRR